jgi:hypothetical protein
MLAQAALVVSADPFMAMVAVDPGVGIPSEFLAAMKAVDFDDDGYVTAPSARNVTCERSGPRVRSM